jgi:methylated-DNA-protein-cysteine methyltransferase related protein
VTKITPEWLSAVHAVVAAIEPGQVLSYAQVARRAGRPGHARQVARALASHDGSALPWHRVLRADGRIGLPRDSVAHAEQVARLRAEGHVVESGRLRRTTIQPDLDALVWGPDPGTAAP